MIRRYGKGINNKLFLIILFICLLVEVIFLGRFFLIYKINKMQLEFLEDKALEYEILKNGKVDLSLMEDELEFLKSELISEYDYIDLNEVESYILEVGDKNQKLEEEIGNLEKEVNDNKIKKQKLSDELQEKEKLRQEKVRLEEEARELSSTYQISGVSTISQFPTYPTGCESTALTILLRYYGINVSVDSVVSNLSKGGYLYYKDNVRYGGNPEKQFVGDPTDPLSFGAYEGPIIEVANKFKTGIISGRGSSFDTVLGIVKQGRPVMVWTTINLLEPYVVASWIYDATGEKMVWYAHEHAVVIVGFSNKYVIVSDPYTGTIKKQSRGLFESRYNSLGKRCLYY